tara:strand:+ start:1560 stop:1772 length:213 start_codon:yes stop_codon:yes gene_type:complete
VNKKLDMNFIDDDLLLPLNDIWWNEKKIDYFLLCIDNRSKPVKDYSHLSPYYEYLAKKKLIETDLNPNNI